jgi:hypothetical protein
MIVQYLARPSTNCRVPSSTRLCAPRIHDSAPHADAMNKLQSLFTPHAMTSSMRARSIDVATCWMVARSFKFMHGWFRRHEDCGRWRVPKVSPKLPKSGPKHRSQINQNKVEIPPVFLTFQTSSRDGCRGDGHAMTRGNSMAAMASVCLRVFNASRM